MIGLTKWSCDVASTIYKVTCFWLCEALVVCKTFKILNLKPLKRGFNERGLSHHQAAINFT